MLLQPSERQARNQRKIADLNKEVLRNLKINAELAKAQVRAGEKGESHRKRDSISSMLEQGDYGVICLMPELLRRKNSLALAKIFGKQSKSEAQLASEAEKLFREVREEAKKATEEYDEKTKAINAYLEAYYASIGLNQIMPTGASDGGGGGGGIVESATQAYERLNAERAKLNHQMKVGEISTAQYLASLQRIERDMRAGVEEQKIWANKRNSIPWRQK